MRSSIILFALGAAASTSAAALQARQSYPACVGTCIASAATEAQCTTSDAACLCQSTTFINAAASCFASSCSASDAAVGVSTGEQLCATVGYTISIPAAASSALAAGSSTASSGEAATSTASGAVSSSASSIASAIESTASSVSSAAAASTSATTGAGIALTRNNALAGLAAIGTFVAVAL